MIYNVGKPALKVYGQQVPMIMKNMHTKYV